MARILVCGGTDFTDAKRMALVLDAAIDRLDLTEIVQGGAPGADFLALQWAIGRGIPHLDFEADWRHFGNAAGPMRNKAMLEETKPDLVLAFSGHEGTLNMKVQAAQAGVKVIDC